MQKDACFGMLNKRNRPMGPDSPLQALLQMLHNSGQASVQNQVCVSCMEMTMVLIVWYHMFVECHLYGQTYAKDSSFTTPKYSSVLSRWLNKACSCAFIKLGQL